MTNNWLDLHGHPGEWDDRWEKGIVEPNEICPECKSHNINMWWREDYPQTWEEPAEHSYTGDCNDCDAEFEYPDEEEKEK